MIIESGEPNALSVRPVEQVFRGSNMPPGCDLGKPWLPKVLCENIEQIAVLATA